ncbi:ATP-binding protein [Desulfomonile tiedjei]|uniref:Putative ATPase n=1 Tax=Desulfomonile tiedjei (strain ATCC 49306 / DSM 6799 / DCB-1) TaxID=706587 RepID=I4C1A1_DESTA|nr:ATP-binding protein [Desulfomonile tiedjei]AFM23342.1 putative ATPase [Desulfomonile tiedjei DSM 6799]
MSTNKIGQVLSCAPNSIIIEIADLGTFEKHKSDLQIGRYLKIAQGNNDYTIAAIKTLKGVNDSDRNGNPEWQFTIECQAVGTLVGNEIFERGSILLPVPTEPVYMADKITLDKLFTLDDQFNFPFGLLSLNKEISLKIDGNRFFSKHIAVVGSTGSGKSCTVAKILHDVVGIAGCKNLLCEQNNSHIIIFDIHDEYRSAFQLDQDQSFTLNVLDVDSLKLPYWLMNSEELESMFIESNEANSHNQVSQFKNAVILNKEKHNPHVKEMTYDTPVFFSIREVRQYIENMNREIIGRLPNENLPKLTDGQLVADRKDFYFDKIHDFVPASTAKETKATNGPFNGEFNRFVSRLETSLSDKRLKFLLDPLKPTGEQYSTSDFEEIMQQFLGYLNKSNVTIVDLSGIPFEVLSITVSLVSRLIFDFCFHYSKLRRDQDLLNDIPVMIVCEEAHNYVPQNDAVAYRSSRKSLERIAKEGRKYGLSLMVVSQRPSEVSETIFAQCNNFVALRLTNDSDQGYVRRLFPDNTSAITDILPNLAPGECIVVGDAVLLPAIIQMGLPNPQPQSQSVNFHEEWQSPWRDVTFNDVITRWRKE